MVADAGTDVVADAGIDVRGRATRRITRLEERLGQTRVQLDRAKGRRDELEHLLQRMVDAESSRRDQLKVREAEIERREAQLEAMRQDLEQRTAVAEQEANQSRDVRAELERREQETRAQVQSLRSRVAELEGRGEEASQELREELRQAKSQAERARGQRQGLEAQLAEQRELARDASRQLVAAVERREELEAAYGAVQDEAEEARAQAADAKWRLTELERETGRLRAEVEDARARSAEERDWHNQLEARLSETEKQADLVLKDLDEELEIALGRAALERERRVAAETRLAELEEWHAQAEAERPVAHVEPGDQLPALAEAEREIERLRAELDAARSGAGTFQAATPSEPGPELETVRAELEDAREQADTLKVSQEQSRRRILQLEDRLGKEHSDVAIVSEEPLEPADEEPADEEPAGDATETRGRLLGSRGGADRESRAPLKDPAELPGMSDEELALTFSAMREAAKLAEARDDRESAKSHRALARAVAEEAAGRPEFGETKARGRKRNRALKELAAAREKALELRPLMTGADQGDEPPAV